MIPKSANIHTSRPSSNIPRAPNPFILTPSHVGESEQAISSRSADAGENEMVRVSLPEIAVSGAPWQILPPRKPNRALFGSILTHDMYKDYTGCTQ